MKILVATTGVTSKTVEFTRKSSGVIIRVENATGLVGTISALKANMYIHSPNAGKRFTAFDNVALIYLAELCSMDTESTIKAGQLFTFNGASPEVVVAGGVTIYEFRIDLTADGHGIDIADNEKWVLEITGMSASDTYTAWALESLDTTKAPVKYEVLTTGAFTNQFFNLVDADRLFIMKYGSISSIEFRTAQGQIKVELDEISAQIRNGYGAVYSIVQYLSSALIPFTYSVNEGVQGYLVPVTGFTGVQVNTSGAVAITVVKMSF